MKKVFKFIKELLDKIPFNDNKSNIGQIIFFLGLAIDFWDKLLPVLTTVEQYVSPQYAAGIGAVIVVVGKLHQILKKLFPEEIPDLKNAPKKK